MIKPKKNYSRKLIKDEFTALKVSRGRKWQLRRVKAGLCIRCDNPLAPGQELCVKHRIEQAQAYRKKLNSSRPHKGKWVGA
jgi:RNase P subunit RPR2